MVSLLPPPTMCKVSIFLPVNRPASCGITFQTDLGVSWVTNSVITNGQNVTFTLSATNYGPGAVDGANLIANLAPSLTNITWTTTTYGNANATAPINFPSM